MMEATMLMPLTCLMSTLMIGADMLVRAVLSDEFENASDRYCDNDSGQFVFSRLDALNQ